MPDLWLPPEAWVLVASAALLAVSIAGFAVRRWLDNAIDTAVTLGGAR